MLMSDDCEKKSRQRPEFFCRTYVRMNGGTPERPNEIARMARSTRVGKLPPRYGFILNPHGGTRLSKCPRCERYTHPRKFAFFIHVEGWGPMALGKTCKYCSRCELIMMHQDELEAELTYSFRATNKNGR
jgi:hypothetical protein